MFQHVINFKNALSIRVHFCEFIKIRVYYKYFRLKSTIVVNIIILNIIIKIQTRISQRIIHPLSRYVVIDIENHGLSR